MNIYFALNFIIRSVSSFVRSLKGYNVSLVYLPLTFPTVFVACPSQSWLEEQAKGIARGVSVLTSPRYGLCLFIDFLLSILYLTRLVTLRL